MATRHSGRACGEEGTDRVLGLWREKRYLGIRLGFKGLMEQISHLQEDYVGSQFYCKKTGELSARRGEALAQGKITPMRARMKENAR